MGMGVGALVLVSCAGDDGPTVDPEADQEVVDDAVLTAADLPDGFEEVEPDDRDDDPPCTDVLDISAESFENARTARSDPKQFASGEASVRARVSAFESDDIPAEVIDAFDGDDFLNCIRADFEDELGDDATVTTFEAIDPLVGDEATAYQLRVVVESEVGVVESHTAAVLVDDRFVVSFDMTALEGGVDQGLMADALATMAENVERAA